MENDGEDKKVEGSPPPQKPAGWPADLEILDGNKFPPT